MNNSLVKTGLFCWMVCNAVVFAALVVSPHGKVALLVPWLLPLRDLLWPLFYRASII